MSAHALRTALARIGFTNEAAAEIVNVQGIDSLAEFELLSDTEAESLCKVIRRPGGTLANPTEGEPPVPNHGHAVSLRAENNLKLMCYLLRFKTRTSRTLSTSDITLEAIRGMKSHKEWEEKHEDVDPPTINTKDWPRTIEAIEEYLRGCLGATKIPLAYVIREDEAVPHTDPTGGYNNYEEELIARAPIVDGAGNYTTTYLADRIKVWEKLSEITRDLDCYSYIRPAQRRCDSRLAFLGLKGHYLGPNNVDNMSSAAEKKLQTTTYHSEQRRWNFEKYVKTHVDQHAILEGLVEHGYAGIDERSKVRHLMNGIKNRDFDPVKTRILSDATLRSNFDQCVNLYKDFIEQRSSDKNVRDANVSAFQANSKNLSGDVEPDMSVPDRYYKHNEYVKLTQAQKLGLKMKRAKRGHKPSAKNKQEANLSKRSIKAIASAITKMQMTDDHDSDGSDDEDVPMKPPAKKAKIQSNRTNPALSRN